MCGFAGMLLRRPECREHHLAALRSATRSIQHRGPDDEAFYVSEQFAAGFRRLSIIDLSEDGRQPMSDESGRYWLVFNGELYNYRELRSELERQGVRFTSKSDTEVLLKSYVAWGEDCLSRFNGMFAFLLWDEQERVLFGARDRFGEKPLYYTQTNDAVYFASEIKALFPFLGHVPEWRPEIARRYIQQGLIDCSPDTFFRGVYQVPAANRLHVRDGRLTIEPYWELKETDDFAGDPVEAFRELFLDSIRLRTRSDVPVGTCLSGGLDSGSIVCGMAKVVEPGSGTVVRKTFTAAYPEYDESNEVRLVNEASGSTGYSIIPAPNGLDDFEHLLRFHDEPFHSLSTFASHAVMGLARQNGIVVLLNGQGADEVLAGYPKYLKFAVCDLLRRGQLLKAGLLAGDGRSLTGMSRGKALAEAGRIWLRRSVPNSLWNESHSSVRRSRQAIDQCCMLPEFIERCDGDRTREFQSSFKGALKSQLQFSLYGSHLPLYLRIEDRNSMAHSMESRLPFLDHRLAELAFSWPTDVFMKDGQNKHVLRRAMQGILPDPVLNRREKFGFPVPQDKWIFEDLHSGVVDILKSSELRGRGIFEQHRLEQRFAADSQGRQTETMDFWFRVVAFEVWARTVASGFHMAKSDEGADDMRIVNQWRGCGTVSIGAAPA